MLYLGSLDDVVTRYPWTGQRQALDFNQTLLNNLLFGEPCLINDGYVAQSAQALAGIKRPGESSLIEVLVEEGYATILCRADPRDMLEAMVAGGVESHAALASDPEVQSAMKVWSDKLHATRAYRDWPDVDFGQGFYRLARLTQNAPVETLGLDALPEPMFRAVVGDFVIAFEAKPFGARTQWETAAKRHCAHISDRALRLAALTEAMNFANEIYHMNFSGLLAARWQEPVAVDTRLNPLFFWMMQGAEEFHSGEDDNEAQRELPVAALPWGQVTIDISDGEAVARPFLTEGREEFAAREGFLAARERLFSAPDDTDIRRDFREAVDRYDKVLSNLFGLGKSTAEIAYETFVDPVAHALDTRAKGQFVGWVEELMPYLPSEPLSVAITGLLQSRPFVSSYLSNRSLTMKRSLRSFGRVRGAMGDYSGDLVARLGQDKHRAKDVMTGIALHQDICTPFFSGIGPVST